jgi:hypothetical protein
MFAAAAQAVLEQGRQAGADGEFVVEVVQFGP